MRVFITRVSHTRDQHHTLRRLIHPHPRVQTPRLSASQPRIALHRMFFQLISARQKRTVIWPVVGRVVRGNINLAIRLPSTKKPGRKQHHNSKFGFHGDPIVFRLEALVRSRKIVPHYGHRWKAFPSPSLAERGLRIIVRKISPAPARAPSTARRAPANISLRKPRSHRCKKQPPPARLPPTAASSGETALSVNM